MRRLRKARSERLDRFSLSAIWLQESYTQMLKMQNANFTRANFLLILLSYLGIDLACEVPAYQVGGSSSHKLPDWRWMEEDLISDIQILNRTFPGARPTASGKHHKWDKLFIRVKPAEKSRK